jgi:hypothetical protein
MLALLLAAVAAGTSVPVPEWTWVKTRNETQVRNFNISFGWDDSCGIDAPGSVRVVAPAYLTDRSDVASLPMQYLVRYEAFGSPAGTQCPTGALFFLPAKYIEGGGPRRSNS